MNQFRSYDMIVEVKDEYLIPGSHTLHRIRTNPYPIIAISCTDIEDIMNNLESESTISPSVFC